MVRYHVESIVRIPQKAYRKHNFTFTKFLDREIEQQSDRSNMDVLRAIWNEVSTCMQGTCQYFISFTCETLTCGCLEHFLKETCRLTAVARTHQSAVRVLEITATCSDDLSCRIDSGRILKESCL
jgi:hypothetical protein